MKNLVILLIIFTVSICTSQTVIIIGFDKTDQNAKSKLDEIEKALAIKLKANGYEVVNENFIVWKNAMYINQKLKRIKSYKGDYSIELLYDSTSSELRNKFINWNKEYDEGEPNMDDKKMLDSYNSSEELHGFGYEWAMDARYFIKYNKKTRPEICIYNFIDDPNTEDLKIKNLLSWLKIHIDDFYLKKTLCKCFKFRTNQDMFNEYIEMSSKVDTIGGIFSITFEFKHPDGSETISPHSRPEIPTNEKEYREFINWLIDNIDWPENTECHD